jgi:hypothetical protein
MPKMPKWEMPKMSKLPKMPKIEVSLCSTIFIIFRKDRMP